MMLVMFPIGPSLRRRQPGTSCRNSHRHLTTHQAMISCAAALDTKLPVSGGQYVHSSEDVVSQAARPQGDLRASCPARLGDKAKCHLAQRILCYGDSVTAGFCAGGRHFQPYGKVLAEALTLGGVPCEATICGLSGLTAAELAAKAGAVALSDFSGNSSKGLNRVLAEDGPYDLALILVGTNDIGHGVPPEAVVEHIIRLHAFCHARGVATVAIAPPTMLAGPARAAREHVARLLESWAHATPDVVAYFDSEKVLPRGPGNGFWEADELHLSAAGSIELGGRLAPRVAPLLAQTSATSGAA